MYQLAISFCEPIDELAPVSFPIGGSSLVFTMYLLTVGSDISFVTDQPNSLLEGCACDRKGKILDVAYAATDAEGDVNRKSVVSSAVTPVFDCHRDRSRDRYPKPIPGRSAARYNRSIRRRSATSQIRFAGEQIEFDDGLIRWVYTQLSPSRRACDGSLAPILRVLFRFALPF